MRRGYAIALIVTLFAVGAIWASRWAASLVPPDVEVELPAEVPLPPSDDCRLACVRLEMCASPFAGPECESACEAKWPTRAAKCVQRVACEKLDGCFVDVAAADCPAACEKAVECGFVVDGDDCETICRDEWNPDLRDCLIATACEEVEATCLPALGPGPCAMYCARLEECGLVGQGESVDCLNYCLTVDDPEVRNCALRVDCDAIESVCLAENHDPLCLDVCDRVSDCGGISGITDRACPSICQDSWNDTTKICLMDADCAALGSTCLSRPDAACVEICDKLTSCGLEDNAADCALSCSTELPDELRRCVSESPCETLDAKCFGMGPDVCRLVCEKAVLCQLDDEYDACYAACEEGYDTDLVMCLLSFPCEEIPQNCLTP